ncbi:RNA polymerase sigma factor [Chitinophaga sp. S165]|uniref:RNA polymerase sigma factor n=1 Tax=Chitinophaga sp. S165 TaxID=2135462 RepID=UPI000D71DA4A|nr:RNA polymerase sigma-70 factor [Chitinophaga sp. S165]PWV46533.1 RNA polymerase sigma-70 factor (ECF subfamily) [Chitinophaga sp. S165]
MPPSDLQHISDATLWQLVMEGNVSAYGELYERYWESLFETAFWHLYDKDAAKDIVQEVFVYCWQKREQIQINESVPAYFRAAVRFKVLNHLKSENTREKYQQLAGQALPQITHSAGEYMAKTDLQASYRRELARLPDKMREVFIDSRDHGLSIEEIAQKRGISTQTVKNQLSTALKKLREGLGNFFME